MPRLKALYERRPVDGFEESGLRVTVEVAFTAG
jgi:hypothetical protein